MPLLSRRSRIFAGFVYAIKCARFLGGSCKNYIGAAPARARQLLKKGDVMTLISSGKTAAGLRRILLSLAAVAAVVSLGAAQAQATRTWVSGVGDDANPCSRTAPCKTFPGAISKTAAGGEITVSIPAASAA